MAEEKGDNEYLLGVVIGLLMVGVGGLALYVGGQDGVWKVGIMAMMVSVTIWFIYESRHEVDSYSYEAPHRPRSLGPHGH